MRTVLLCTIRVCILQDIILEAEEPDPIDPSSINNVSHQRPLVPDKKYASFKKHAIS